MSSLPAAGVGLVYSPKLHDFIESSGDLLDVVEVEPQTLWRHVGASQHPYVADEALFDRVAQLPQAKLIHGVGFPVGASRSSGSAHMPLYLEAVRTLDALWASEHLAFNRAHSGHDWYHTGFLLPPRQTVAGAHAAAETIRATASNLPVAFAVETGVNYLKPRPDEVSDGEFLHRVVDAADCGILLDLHNLWANERNGRQPVREFLAEIPLDRVYEVHLAGGIEYDGYWLDAHSGLVPDPLLEVAAEVVPQLPAVGAIILEIESSFIDRIDFTALRQQLDLLCKLWETRGSRTSRQASQDSGYDVADADAITPAVWEDTLGALVVGGDPTHHLASELRRDPGVEIYRRLVRDLRAGMIVTAFRLTCRLIRLQAGEVVLNRLLAEFYSSRPPQLFGSDEAKAFAAYLRRTGFTVEYLSEVLAFEDAVLHTALDGQARVVPFEREPMPMLDALANGTVPSSIPRGTFEVQVTPDDSSYGRSAGSVLSST